MEDLNAKRVAIVVQFPNFGYSGGRYYALMMSLGLAEAGFRVDIYTDNVPEMHRDFSHFTSYSTISWKQSKRSPRSADPKNYDFVVCVPDLTKSTRVYQLSLELSIRDSAQLILLDFESLEWFNTESGTQRSKSRYFGPKTISQGADMILSLTKYGSNRARESYWDVYSDNVYSYVYPGINSSFLVRQPRSQDRDTIFFPTRLSNGKHKNGSSLKKFLERTPSGSRVSVLIDNHPSNDDFLKSVEKQAKKLQIDLVVHQSICDKEKFQELARSKIVVLPSLFEGYGYSLVEAIHAGATVVAYRLPVFVELTADKIPLIPIGYEDELFQAFEDALNSAYPTGKIAPEMPADDARFEVFSRKLKEQFLSCGPQNIDEELERDCARNRAHRTFTTHRKQLTKSLTVDQIYGLIPSFLRNRIHRVRTSHQQYEKQTLKNNI